MDKLKGKHILIVEDNPYIGDILERLTTHYGVRASHAESGIEALKEVEHEPPDLILLDLGLPDMNGLEVATRVRQNAKTKSVPIIVISATPDQRENCLNSGCNDFIQKPFHASDLLARISRFFY